MMNDINDDDVPPPLPVLRSARPVRNVAPVMNQNYNMPPITEQNYNMLPIIDPNRDQPPFMRFNMMNPIRSSRNKQEIVRWLRVNLIVNKEKLEQAFVDRDKFKKFFNNNNYANEIWDNYDNLVAEYGFRGGGINKKKKILSKKKKGTKKSKKSKVSKKNKMTKKKKGTKKYKSITS